MSTKSNGFSIDMDAEALAPLVRLIAREVAAEMQADAALIGDKIAFSEAEASRLLSLNIHQLRGERLKKRIKASVGPGKKILYSRQDLSEYLASRRWNGGPPA